VIVWDGSTKGMWSTKPAKIREEIQTETFVDENPKTGIKFGMVVPKTLYASFVDLYQTSPSPQQFMQTVSETFLAGNYPGDFEMSANHVIAGRCNIYRLCTTSSEGKTSKKKFYNASGMLVMDLKQEWLSESYGPTAD
jgi:hypothetical protein